MGFKFKRVDFTAGTTDFPTGSTDALRRTRSENVLKACVQAIIDCNCGWQLDSTKSTSITDFTDIPCRTGANLSPGLFLINSQSGCKLFITYNAYSANESVKDFSGSDVYRCNSGSDRFVSGLCVSVIPDDSLNNFGDPTTTTFIPNDATRIVGTVNRHGGGSSGQSYCYGPSSGYIHSWGLFVTPYVIAVSANRDQSNPPNLSIPAFFAGRIIGTLAHQELWNHSKYGMFCMRTCDDSTSNTEGNNSVIYNSFSIGSGSNTNFFGKDMRGVPSFNQAYVYVCGAIVKSDGTWINGSDLTNYYVTSYVSDPYQLSGYVFNSTGNGKSRWSPIAITCVSSDLSTYGVVDGDGFKGYIDTDLIRCALGTYGQTFDNGNFICIDSNMKILIGWDSANTDSIAG